MNHFVIVFFDSFLSFFGLSQDPMNAILHERNKKSDADRLAEDWHKVGQYITNAYEKCEQSYQ